MFTRPDNSVYPSKTIPSDVDMAELAARLSINRLRRSGRVVFYDDFICKDTWISNFYGSSEFNIYSQIAIPGGFKFAPFTPPGMMVFTVAPGEVPYICQNIPVVAHSNLGIELTFSFIDPTIYPSAITIEYQSNGIGFTTRWSALTHTWQINNNGNWIDILTMSPTPVWHNVKIILDIINKRFLYLFVDRDIAAINQPGQSATGEGYLIMQVSGDPTNTTYAALDSIIITTDEMP